MTTQNRSGKNFIQGLLAVVSGIIVSTIYLYFISEYCTTVYEAMLPDRDNYYSKIARFPIVLPVGVFIIVNIIIFLSMKKRYKVYAFTYILLTMIISLFLFFFVKTNIFHGV
jgi:hypothetical protein